MDSISDWLYEGLDEKEKESLSKSLNKKKRPTNDIEHWYRDMWMDVRRINKVNY